MEKFWVPTSFQSTTSILGTQGSSNFSCIKPTQGSVLLMMLGGSNFETRKKGFLLLGGGSYHQIPVFELVPRMPMTITSTYLPVVYTVNSYHLVKGSPRDSSLSGIFSDSSWRIQTKGISGHWQVEKIHLAFGDQNAKDATRFDEHISYQGWWTCIVKNWSHFF